MGMSYNKALIDHFGQDFVNRFPELKTPPMRPRFLMSLHGKTLTVKADMERSIKTSPLIQQILHLNGYTVGDLINNGGFIGNKKVGKFLKSVLPASEVDPFVKSLSETQKSIEFEFRCQPKDILRLSDSKHFTSCLRQGGDRPEEKYYYIMNPNIAVLVNKDRSGSIVNRIVVYSVQFRGRNALVLSSRGYGEAFNDVDTIKRIRDNSPVKTYLSGPHSWAKMLKPNHKGISPEEFILASSFDERIGINTII